MFFSLSNVEFYGFERGRKNPAISIAIVVVVASFEYAPHFFSVAISSFFLFKKENRKWREYVRSCYI